MFQLRSRDIHGTSPAANRFYEECRPGRSFHPVPPAGHEVNVMPVRFSREQIRIKRNSEFRKRLDGVPGKSVGEIFEELEKEERERKGKFQKGGAK